MDEFVTLENKTVPSTAMTDFSNDGSQQNPDSLFDHLMQALGLDSQQQNIPEPTDFNSNWQDAFNQHDLNSDVQQGNWNGEHHQSWQSSSVPNLDHPIPELGTTETHLESFNPYQLPEQTDYSTGYHLNQDSGGIDYHAQQVSNVAEMQTFNYVEKGDSNSVHIYADGDVYWDSSGGKAGHIEGQKFYNNGDHYIGCLGADMKVYDAHDKCIGWVDTKGRAYTLDGAVFAEGKTPIWAATVLVFNTSSPG